MEKNKYRFETVQLHAGQEKPDPATGARAVPVYQTVSYVFDSFDQAAARFSLNEGGNIYGRLTNPTQDVFEQRIAALEGGESALAVASGASAITYSILNIASAGNNIVSSQNIYGGTYNLFAHTLPLYGINTIFVDPDGTGAFENAVDENTKALYIETVGNPNATLIDIEKAAEVAHRHKIPLIVDNTFATPYLVRPIEYGADIVIHSATKFIGGHGTALGGVIIDGGNFDWSGSGRFPQLTEPDEGYHGMKFSEAAGKSAFVTRIRAVLLRDTGAAIAPLHSFLFLQGLETLSLRLERHTFNALKIVEFLSAHPKVEKVNHPSVEGHPHNGLYKKYFPDGGISIFTFNIKGGEKEARMFIDSLDIFSLLANVADVKSLVIHPASTTHAQLPHEELSKQGINSNTIRLSVGTEHIDDLIADLDNALSNI